ncbi:hypothetical protein [Nostoc sp. 2RC]|uniref:hypothetical protein n=1 Tax=Nostoc sp. 2RC TaxID=2485484 RepID=UPI0028937BE6|nr:hypothetical protein [Nostoc sp. 2RC]
MSKLFEILQKIKSKPGMYIGRASVNDLFHFLVGFKTALRELGVKATEEEMDFYRNFQPWVQKNIMCQLLTLGQKLSCFTVGMNKRVLILFIVC